MHSASTPSSNESSTSSSDGMLPPNRLCSAFAAASMLTWQKAGIMACQSTAGSSGKIASRRATSASRASPYGRESAAETARQECVHWM